MIDNKGITFQVNVMYTGYHDKIVSYVYYSNQAEKMLAPIWKELENSFPELEKGNSIYFGLSYFNDHSTFKTLTGLILNHVVSQDIDKKFALFLIRGKYSMLMYEELGAVRLKTQPQRNGVGTLYIYALDLRKFLGHPIVMNLIVEGYCNYKKLELDFDSEV